MRGLIGALLAAAVVAADAQAQPQGDALAAQYIQAYTALHAHR